MGGEWERGEGGGTLKERGGREGEGDCDGGDREMGRKEDVDG